MQISAEDTQVLLLFMCHYNQLLGVAVKDVAIEARRVEFDSRAGQVRHNVANSSSPLRRFFGAVLSRC